MALGLSSELLPKKGEQLAVGNPFNIITYIIHYHNSPNTSYRCTTYSVTWGFNTIRSLKAKLFMILKARLMLFALCDRREPDNQYFPLHVLSLCSSLYWMRHKSILPHSAPWLTGASQGAESCYEMCESLSKFQKWLNETPDNTLQVFREICLKYLDNCNVIPRKKNWTENNKIIAMGKQLCTYFL